MRTFEELDRLSFKHEIRQFVPNFRLLFCGIRDLFTNRKEVQIIDLLKNIHDALDDYEEWLIDWEVDRLRDTWLIRRDLGKYRFHCGESEYFFDYSGEPNTDLIIRDFDIPTQETEKIIDFLSIYLSDLENPYKEFNDDSLSDYLEYELYGAIAYEMLNNLVDTIQEKTYLNGFDIENKVIDCFSALYIANQEYYKHVIQDQEIKQKIERTQIEQNILKRNATRAAHERHHEKREQKEKAIHHFLTENKQTGISKNEFAKKYHQHYGVAEKTLRNNWLQGIN